MHLELIRGPDTLDLDALLAGSATGAQALEGLTGTGLPPLEVQWAEGAGHGAAYRGTRVLPRDFDLPLHLAAPTRAGLNAQLSTLARILDPLSGNGATLRAGVPGMGTWSMGVRRVGGGDIVQESESRRVTGGACWLDTVIQLRAGDSFWNASETATVTARSFPAELSITNTGDARAWPTWHLSGPATALSITGPGGQRLGYTEEPGSYRWGDVTIAAVSGTITDGAGDSLYHLLDPAPRFIPLDPGTHTFTIHATGTTAATTLTCTWRTRRWALI